MVFLARRTPNIWLVPLNHMLPMTPAATRRDCRTGSERAIQGEAEKEYHQNSCLVKVGKGFTMLRNGSLIAFALSQNNTAWLVASPARSTGVQALRVPVIPGGWGVISGRDHPDSLNHEGSPKNEVSELLSVPKSLEFCCNGENRARYRWGFG